METLAILLPRLVWALLLAWLAACFGVGMLKYPAEFHKFRRSERGSSLIVTSMCFTMTMVSMLVAGFLLLAACYVMAYGTLPLTINLHN